MNNKVNRSTLTGLQLLILGGLISPVLAATDTQASPPGPYGSGPGMMGGPQGHPGMMGGPQGGPGMMGGPQGGPGMMGGPQGGPPGDMGGPQGGPGMMGGPRGGQGMMGGPQGHPGMMGSPRGGQGDMGGPRGGPGMMGGPRGGQGDMGGPQSGPGMMGSPQGGPGDMDSPQSGPGTKGGPATAILDVISNLDLTAEQRGQLDAIREGLNKREKELVEKIAVAGEKLQKLQQQHIEADQSLRDLNGHLATANMDAANRAEELLTAEQRQRLISSGGAHVMTPAQR